MAAAMNTAENDRVPVPSPGALTIASIPVNRPWQWLARGWDDIICARGASIFWGMLFAIMGLVVLFILHSVRLYNLALPLVAGFMLSAPILAVGLYHVSRELEKGNAVGVGTALGAWKRNTGQVALLGFAVGLLFLFWIRVATLIFALFFGHRPPEAFGTAPPDLLGFIQSVILTTENIEFLVVGCVVGAGIALVVFAITAVSVPMLVDREVSVFDAVVVSVRTVLQNKAAMILWAILIVLFTGAGILAGFIGLAVTMPLIAHATWHAYRDLVKTRSE